MSIYAKQAVVASFPAYDIVEREAMAKNSATRGHYDAPAAFFYLAGYLEGVAPGIASKCQAIGEIYRGRA